MQLALGRKKHTIIIDEALDKDINEYIKKRAIEIIQSGGSIPSEASIFEELLKKGLEVAKREGRSR